jgi:TolA-binding protein
MRRGLFSPLVLLLLVATSFRPALSAPPAPLPDDDVVSGVVRVIQDLAKPAALPQFDETLRTIRSPLEKPREGIEEEVVVLREKEAKSSFCLNPVSAPVARQIKVESVEIQLAIYLINRGDLAEAEKVLGRFIVDFPKGKRIREAWFWLGGVYSRRNALTEARDAFAKAVSLAPPNVSDDLLVYGLYSEGSLSLVTGLSERALRAFERVVPLITDPALLAESHYRRGLALLSVGRVREALDDFTFILASAEGPQTEGALFWLAESWYAAKSWDQAAIRYRQYLTAYPSGKRGEDARMGLAWCYLKMEAWSEAAVVFGDFVRRSEGSPLVDQAEFYRARSTELAGDPGVAAGLYREMAAAFPRSGLADDALLSQALLVRKTAPREAEEALVRLTRDYPDSPNRATAELLLGGFAVSGERYIEALDRFTLAASLDPAGETAPQARFRAAWVMTLLERWEEAGTALASLDADYPRLPWRREVLFWRGKTALAVGKTVEAVRFFSGLAGSEGSRRAESVFALGEAAVLNGNWAEAEQRFRDVAAVAKGDLAADALGNLGLALLNRGRHNEAKAAFDRAAGLTTDPARREWIAFYTTVVLGNAGEFEAAWKSAMAYQKAFPEGRRREEIQMAAGRALANLGRYADALGEFRRVAGGSADRELVFEARSRAAKCLVALGQWSQAVEELQALESDNRSGAWGRDAARELIALAARTGDRAGYSRRVDDYAASFPDDPETPRILLRAAQEALGRGDLAAVLARGRQVIDRYGSGPWGNEARLARADAFLRMGFFAAAAEDIAKVDPREVVTRAADLAFFKAGAFAGIARAAADDGRPKEAAEAFAQAEAVYRLAAVKHRDDPRLPEALDTEAKTAAQLKEWGVARVALTELIAIRGADPSRWALTLRLADAEEGAGDAKRAEELIRAAVSSGDPTTVSLAAHRLGLLLASLGREKEAALEHVRGYLAAKEGPRAAENLWAAAAVHRKLGNDGEERRLLQLLAASGLPSPLTAQAAALLNRQPGTQGER